MDEYGALDGETKAEVPLTDWVQYSGDQAALVREYMAGKKKFQRVSVSLDDFLNGTDEDREKNRKFAERIYKLEHKETG